MSTTKVAPDDKEPLNSDALSESQVQVAVNAATKKRAYRICLVAAFVDLAGAVILQPNYPAMVSNAEGATRNPALPANYSHPHAFPDDGLPPFTIAVNIIITVNFIGQSISAVLMGALSDKVGRRPLMLMGLFTGCVTLLLYYVAGIFVQNYWFFVGLQFLNGLGGGTKGVVQSYIQDIHEPAEFARLQPIIMLAFIFGAAAGGLIGGVVGTSIRLDEHSTDLFTGSLFGSGASFMCLVLVFLFAPEPPKAKQKKTVVKKQPTPVNPIIKKILLILVIASGFDSFGDNGNAFARNTVFTNRYPIGKEPSMNTLLLVLSVLGVFIAMTLVMTTAKKGKISMPQWCMLGNLASAIAQFAVIPNVLPVWGFFLCFMWARCFGFTSTLATMFLLPQYAPAESRGFWVGLQGSVAQLGQAVAPLMLAGIYAATSPPSGSPASEYADAELTCLAITGSISVLAFLLFAPLPALIPKPPPPPPPLDGAAMEAYLNMSVRDFSRLDLRTRMIVNKKLIAEGKTPLDAHWTSYQEDISDGELDKIPARATATLADMKAYLLASLTSRQRLAEIVTRSAKDREASRERYDLDTERAVMSKWITDYLDDAGYDSWYQYPDVYKMFVMDAFPPLEPLDDERGKRDTTEAMEKYLLRWMKMLDSHTKLAKAAEESAGFSSFAKNPFV